ncbi:hypothetical protein HPB51_029628 [Rhipicephalus microplus]|uniref:Uncharacterized protein n=1 Tax=Rhipicephalus microplus TaxID=6941 RepID=A0A9J6CTC7_RHIMP|nr:hypothetical protein HPB51_029628 [Rhipicephalus microplus]
MRHEDPIQANLIQNNFAYCPSDLGRAEWVLQVKEITIDNKDYKASVYSAPYDSSGHGVIRGVNLRLNRDTIQVELQDNRHPPSSIFGGMGTPPQYSSRSLSPRYRDGSTFAIVDTGSRRSVKCAIAMASSVIELTCAVALTQNAEAVVHVRSFGVLQ